MRLVVCALLSLRGVRRTLCLTEHFIKGGVPCHSTIQNWVLRYGLYKLKRKPARLDDWVFFLDHSIEFGKKQCLLILAVSLRQLRKNHFKIRHRDVQVMAVDIVESATAESVTKVLDDVTAHSGLPVQFVSDGGRNLVRGIHDFIEKQGGYSPSFTYDVTHRMALFLKNILENDPAWASFKKEMVDCKRSMVHSAIAFLSPPKPRDKSRWLNVEVFMKWTEAILDFDRRRISSAERKLFTEKIEWTAKYRKDVKRWSKFFLLIENAKKEIKENGFDSGSSNRFGKRIAKIKLGNETLRQFAEDISCYMDEQSAGIHGAYCGCSDIIESVFGKYKLFSGKSPMKEIGKAVLTIPAFVGEITDENVKNAMENISPNDLEKWMTQNIGESFLKRRRQLFVRKIKKPKQKTRGKLRKTA